MQSINDICYQLSQLIPLNNTYNRIPPSKSDIDYNQYVRINGREETINRFNLLPQSDIFDASECEEWQSKMICYIAANKDVALQNIMYEGWCWLEVMKQYYIVVADEVATQR